MYVGVIRMSTTTTAMARAMVIALQIGSKVLLSFLEIRGLAEYSNCFSAGSRLAEAMNVDVVIVVSVEATEVKKRETI